MLAITSTLGKSSQGQSTVSVHRMNGPKSHQTRRGQPPNHGYISACTSATHAYYKCA